MKIFSFGEILWDIYPNEGFIGGAPLNFAAHLAKMGEDVYMVSALGNDDLGGKALEIIKNWGIKTDYIHITPNKESGKCIVTLNGSVPQYNLLQDVAYDYIPATNALPNNSLLYFGTLALRSEYNFNSLQQIISQNCFKHIFVDINIRPPFYSNQSVRFSASTATAIKISIEEAHTFAKCAGVEFTDDLCIFAERIKNEFTNLQCIIITLGEDGAFAFDCISNYTYLCPAVKANTVSSVGAGDSFSAAFLHKYINGESIDNCLKFATKIAARVVESYEAVPEYNIKDFE